MKMVVNLIMFSVFLISSSNLIAATYSLTTSSSSSSSSRSTTLHQLTTSIPKSTTTSKSSSSSSSSCTSGVTPTPTVSPSTMINRYYRYYYNNAVHDLVPVGKRDYTEFVENESEIDFEDNIIKWSTQNEALTLPAQNIVYLSTLDNLAKYSALTVLVALNSKQQVEKVGTKMYGFKIPTGVKLTFVSSDSEDGFIVVEGVDKYPNPKNAPQSGYTQKTIDLEPLDGKINYTYFYYKSGETYGIGRVQNQFEVRSQGNELFIKVRLSQ